MAEHRCRTKATEKLNRRGIACIGMKILGGGGQLIEAALTAQQARGYALSLPISTLVCGIESMDNLQQDLEIARNLTIPSTQLVLLNFAILPTATASRPRSPKGGYTLPGGRSELPTRS